VVCKVWPFRSRRRFRSQIPKFAGVEERHQPVERSLSPALQDCNSRVTRSVSGLSKIVTHLRLR